MHLWTLLLPLALFGVRNGVKGAVISEELVEKEQLLFREDALKSGYLELDLYYDSGKYLVSMQLGSNNDVVHVLVDTGSSDLWVPTVDNVNCISGTNVTKRPTDIAARDLSSEDSSSNSTNMFNCSIYGTFDYKNSSTFSGNDTDFAIAYAGGSLALGEWGQDSVAVNGDSLGDMNFAVAFNSTKPFGVLGIGFPEGESTEILYGLTGNASDAYPQKYENFPEKLKANGIITRMCYSIFSDQDSTGQLLFGAIDHSKYKGMLYEFPMVDAYLTTASPGVRSVSATLNSLSLIIEEESATLVDGFLPVVFDSGTAIASLPYTIVKLVEKQLNLTNDKNSGVFATNCSNLDNVMFGFNLQGVQFNIPALNFFLQLKGSNLCGFAAATSYVQGYLVLGQSFLDSIYMSVDLEAETVALAYANLPSNGDSDIELISTGIPGATAPPSALTYEVSHMVYSTVPLSTTRLSSDINYSTVYIKSLNIAETDSLSSSSSSPSASASVAPDTTPSPSLISVSTIVATTARGAATTASSPKDHPTRLLTLLLLCSVMLLFL